MKQTTDKIMMIRPANFGYNQETSVNNTFQQVDDSFSKRDIQKLAVIEFNNFVDTLRVQNVEVLVFDDTSEPIKPDAVFPNNWITMHADLSLITYPMFAKNRRSERREDIISQLIGDSSCIKRYSFENYEEEEVYLEGTGSMILDRENRIVYACLSPRTDVMLLDKFAILKGYEVVSFTAEDENGMQIYHTNVMMSVGEKLAIVCLESIRKEEERMKVKNKLEATGKEIIDISLQQVHAFVGNMLEVRSKNGQRLMVLSDTAFRNLTSDQKQMISKYDEILNVDIKTIEKYGGGSARCMMAEIFT